MGFRKLTVPQNLVASGLAVVGATIVTHPIDVVKVQLQLSVKDAQADSFSIRRFVGFWAKFQNQVGVRGRQPIKLGQASESCTYFQSQTSHVLGTKTLQKQSQWTAT